MKKLILAGLFLLLLTSSAWATAQAVVFGEQTIGITMTGDADWGGSQRYFVNWIAWKPSAANDVLAVFDGSVTGPMLIYATAMTGDSMVMPIYAFCKPIIDYSACTIGTGANYKVTICVDKSIY